MQQFPYLSQISNSPVPDNVTEVLQYWGVINTNSVIQGGGGLQFLRIILSHNILYIVFWGGNIQIFAYSHLTSQLPHPYKLVYAPVISLVWLCIHANHLVGNHVNHRLLAPYSLCCVQKSSSYSDYY